MTGTAGPPGHRPVSATSGHVPLLGRVTRARRPRRPRRPCSRTRTSCRCGTSQSARTISSSGRVPPRRPFRRSGSTGPPGCRHKNFLLEAPRADPARCSDSHRTGSRHRLARRRGLRQDALQHAGVAADLQAAIGRRHGPCPARTGESARIAARKLARTEPPGFGVRKRSRLLLLFTQCDRYSISALRTVPICAGFNASRAKWPRTAILA
jgi:hypothetical protein